MLKLKDYFFYPFNIMIDFILDFPFRYPRFTFFVLGFVLGYTYK
jgi:hypothetical protein